MKVARGAAPGHGIAEHEAFPSDLSADRLRRVRPPASWLAIAVVALALFPLRTVPEVDERFGTLSISYARVHDEVGPIQYTYDLTYRSKGTFDLTPIYLAAPTPQQQENAPPDSVYAAVSGQLSTVVAVAQVDTLYMWFVLVPDVAGVNVTGQPNQDQSSLRKDLSTPVLVTALSDGHVLGFRAMHALGPSANGIWKAILGCQQVVRPNSRSGTATAWTAEETDQVGRFVSSYTSHKEEGAQLGETVSKRKLRYFAPRPVSRFNSALLAPESTSHGMVQITYTGSERPYSRLRLTDTVVTSINDRQVAASVTVFFLNAVAERSLTDAEANSLRVGLPELLARTRLIPLYTAPSIPMIDSTLAASQVAHADLAAVLSEFRRLNTRPATPRETTPVFLKLRAYLLLSPAVADSLADILTEARSDDPRFRTAVAALGSAGTPQGQKVLRSLLEGRLHDSNLSDALITTLGTVDQPTPETVELLQSISLDTAHSATSTAALLALGGNARNLSATDDSVRAVAVVTWLQQRLSLDTTMERQVALLQAIGNAGLEIALESVLPRTEDKRPLVRRAAVFSLRWLRSSEADSALARGMRDTVDAVRARAVDGLALWPGGRMISEQIRALDREPAVNVRLRLLNSLATVAKANRDPGILAAMARTAAEDPSQDVRTAARRLLSALTEH